VYADGNDDKGALMAPLSLISHLVGVSFQTREGRRLR
jgi:hypothetical protein